MTQFDFDARGLLTNTVFALGTAEEVNEFSEYDPEGRRTNSLDRLGWPTRYSYDGVGRLTRTTFADGSYLRNEYVQSGRLRSTARGPKDTQLSPPIPEFITSYLYDEAGRRTAVINALSQTNYFSYDANGNQTHSVDALGRTNIFLFDVLDRGIGRQFPDLTSETYALDALGRRIGTTNQASVVTRFAFDKLGRLTAVTNGFGTGTSNWATYAYDEVGNQTNQTDALNHATRFDYDAMGKRTLTVLPGGQSEGMTYNAQGNVAYHTNFNSVVITNVYDALDRLTDRTAPDGYSISYSYSATGRRLTQTDSSGNYSFVYDSRDRLTTNSGPVGVLLYTYDLYGRLQTIGSTRSGGASISYLYDALNRITNVTDATAGTTIYAFDGVGNLGTVLLPNGVTNLYSYDDLNRLTSLAVDSDSESLASFSYGLGLAGNRTNLTESVDGDARTFGWAYDALYRLTDEVITQTAPTGTIGYIHDAVGNRTARTSTVSGITNQSFGYTSNDRLTTHSYDPNGNTTNGVGYAYQYDVENRLIDFNDGGVTFTYNASGIRVSKTVGSVTTLYLVDEQNPTGYAQVLEELEVSSGTTNLVKVYTYGLDLIAQRRASDDDIHFYGYDGSGTTRFLTDTNADISDTYVYDAFGTLLASSGTTTNLYLYTGEQLDTDLGFYYLRARYNNPGIGRFWSRDLLSGFNEEPASLHRYLYVYNNPVNAIDPSGQITLPEIGSVISKIAGLAARTLLPTTTVKTFITRVALGSTIASGAIIYATHYIPPTTDELDRLAITFWDFGDQLLAAEATELAAKGRQLYANILLENSVRPFTVAQLGLAINGARAYSNARDINQFVNDVNSSLAMGSLALGAPFTFQVDRLKAAKALIKFEAAPAADVDLFRLAYIARQNGDNAGSSLHIAELAQSLEKYGTVAQTIP